jgi:hypothetical protein
VQNKLFFSIFVKILYSFGLTSLVSILGGLFFMNVGFLFLPTFLFFFIAQLIGFYFYGEHVKRKNAYMQAQLELAAAAELAKITTDVVCPCDKKVQTTIAVEMNSDNSYICSQCEKKISVVLEAKTFLKTDPLQEDPLKNPVILENMKEALKNPKHNDRI